MSKPGYCKHDVHVTETCMICEPPAPVAVDLFVVQRREGKKWATVQSPYEHDNNREVFDSVTQAETVADWWQGRARIVRIKGEVVE